MVELLRSRALNRLVRDDIAHDCGSSPCALFLFGLDSGVALRHRWRAPDLSKGWDAFNVKAKDDAKRQ